MRRLALVAISCSLLCIACQTGQLGSLSEEDVVAIRNTAAAYHEAAVAKDWDAVATYYTTDAVIMPPNQPAVRGRDGIKVWYAGFPPVTEPLTDSGKNLAIWRKQTDGSWRIAVDVFNSDLPLPSMGSEHMEREEHN